MILTIPNLLLEKNLSTLVLTAWDGMSNFKIAVILNFKMAAISIQFVQ